MKKIVLGIGGSSGSIYAKQILDTFQQLSGQIAQCGIVMSENARTNWDLELPGVDIEGYGFTIYGKRDFNAPFASGSAQFDTMIVCPCSAGLLGRIANGVSGDLMTRAADVVLKERRKLILVIRETPYNLVHIENMRRVTLAGGIICPATPSFYSKPRTIEDLARTVTDRICDIVGLDIRTYRWGGE